MLNNPTHRRRFLQFSTAMAASTLWANRFEGIVLAQPKLTEYPFQVGVASGDPTADGFVLWTRLAMQPITGGGMPKENITVQWQVATDEKLTKVVKSGEVVANPDWAHSVHVEVAGLEPDRWYFYQFKVGNEISPLGRTRTMPLASQMPERLKFAFASCQHFESGLYTAYEHMQREGLDLVLHLGDYIYEGAPKKIPSIRTHSGTREIESIDDYRNRHAQYKTDKALQDMHAQAPWLVTWDDHEFDNNCAGAISEQKDVKPEDFLVRRAAAYKAYYEHMPLRRTSLPRGADMVLYRACDFGQLAQFQVLDTRQYRTDQPCGDKTTKPCGDELNPNATLLGREQQQWLDQQLKSSPAKWNFLAQQVMFARIDRKAGADEAYSMDQWPGYEANRQQIMKFLLQEKIKNPVILTGDIHSNWANNIEFQQPGQKSATSVATELVGTSISSGGDGIAEGKFQKELLAENPCVQFHNSQRGYVTCEVTPKQYEAKYQIVEYVQKPGAPLKTAAKFVVETDRPILHKA
jgi:alkaline phosphatase D